MGMKWTCKQHFKMQFHMVSHNVKGLNNPIAIKKCWLYNKGITPYQRYYA